MMKIRDVDVVVVMLAMFTPLGGVVSSTIPDDKCGQASTMQMRFNIDSRRNETGQWVSKVQLKHTDVGEKEGQPWTVDVEQSTTDCGGEGYVVVDAILTSPAMDTSSVARTRDRFEYHEEAHTWKEARAICEKRSMHLAMPVSEDEAEYLAGLIKHTEDARNVGPQTFVYLGLSKSAGQTVYSTVTGKPLQSVYHLWEKGDIMSDTKSADRCGVIGKTRLLNAVDCTEKLYFFCEK